MKVTERVRYGSRGQGSLIRYEGVANWFSCYCAHGKEVRESTETDDLKAARRFHRQRLEEVAADRQGGKKFVAPTAARVTVGELLTDLERDYALRGVRSLKQVRAHLAPIRESFGAVRASQVSASAVDRYVETRLATPTRHGTMTAPATVNRETQLLGQALRLGLERGNLNTLPSIRHLPERNTRQGFFEAGAFEAVVANLPGHLQDLARFGYLTGWLRGEILTLTWGDVDRDGGVVRLRGEHSKNGQGRTLALEGDVKALIERRWQARVITGEDGQPYRVAELVFHRAGRPIVDYRKAWLTACVTVGLAQPKLDAQGRPVLDRQGRPRMAATKLVHDLRRTAARNLVRAGVPERVAMAVTGHKTRAMFDRYNIVSEEDLRAAMQRQTEYVARLPKSATVTSLAAASR
jgi:integrase